MSETRSAEEIQRDVQRRRAELDDSLHELSSRTYNRGFRVKGISGDVPAWAFAAGGVLGLMFLRRPLWPLKMAGRLVGMAAPIAIPILVKRLGRSSLGRG